jgi:integrase
LNGCDPEFRPLARAALESGCRYGELVRITVSDFNPDAATITIRKSKTNKLRHVALTPEGAEFFQQATAGRAGDALMFRRADGAPWRASNQGRFMAAACERAAIRPAIGFHQLRHTWASLSVMNGVPLLVVAKVLGHRDSKMAELHYAHLAPSYVAEAVRLGAPRYGAAQSSNVKPLRAFSRQ